MGSGGAFELPAVLYPATPVASSEPVVNDHERHASAVQRLARVFARGASALASLTDNPETLPSWKKTRLGLQEVVRFGTSYGGRGDEARESL